MRAAALELRPFAWVATVAFVIGFLGYLAVARPAPAPAYAAQPQALPASGPASDAWNFKKTI